MFIADMPGYSARGGKSRPHNQHNRFQDSQRNLKQNCHQGNINNSGNGRPATSHGNNINNRGNYGNNSIINNNMLNNRLDAFQRIPYNTQAQLSNWMANSPAIIQPNGQGTTLSRPGFNVAPPLRPLMTLNTAMPPSRPPSANMFEQRAFPSSNRELPARQNRLSFSSSSSIGPAPTAPTEQVSRFDNSMKLIQAKQEGNFCYNHIYN